MNPSTITPATINQTYIGIERINFTIQITNDTHRNNAVQTISRIVQCKILPIPDPETSELQAIKITDISIEIESPSIMIHGKGKKERGVVLNKKTAEHLKQYILHYHGSNPNPDAPLFFTVIHGNVNPISERNIERIVKKYADMVRMERSDIPDRVYPHMLRRSRASGLYRDGVPIEMIAAILGHSSSETTKIYAIPSVEQLREAIEKGQPDISREEKLWTDKESEMRKLFGLN